MARVVVSDPLAEEGYALLRERGHDPVDVTGLDGDARAAAVAQAEAWIVRSGTRLGPDEMAAAPRLRAVGRAGVGVDNVDLEAATAAGVAVFNSPTGNITSAAEQAWALMLAAARRVPEADAAMKEGDWARKRLKGVELAGKTLFIVGLGRIGRMMARRAQAFEMTCLGFDPFVTAEAAAGFGVEKVELEDGFRRADVVTFHTPLTSKTRDLLDAERVAMLKEGCIVVNAARGGLLDEPALLEGLTSGRVAAAGVDVWSEEPPTDWSLAKHPRVVAAPHLGASTHEAQVKAAVQAVERVCDFLDSGDAGNAVNAQVRVPEPMRPWVGLAEQLAAFGAQAVDGPLSEVVVSAGPDLDADALRIHALVGALRAGTDEPVNAINAPGMADEKGWTVAGRGTPDQADYVCVEVRGDGGGIRLEGTYTPHYGARVTRIDHYDVEFRPRGRFLFTRHDDVPGVLAGITRILADAGVNVADLSLARNGAGAAVAVVRVDGGVPRQARDGLRGLEHVREAHRIRLN